MNISCSLIELSFSLMFVYRVHNVNSELMSGNNPICSFMSFTRLFANVNLCKKYDEALLTKLNYELSYLRHLGHQHSNKPKIYMKNQKQNK
jgi:hypothetical protein